MDGAVAQPMVRSRRSEFPWPILPLLVVAYCALLPREINVNIADIDFRPYRIALVATLPITLRTLVKYPPGASGFDILAGFVASWYIIALFGSDTLENAVVAGLAQGLDFTMAYLTGRAAIRNTHHFRYFFIFVLPGFAVVALLLAAESLNGQLIVRPIMSDLTGEAAPFFYEEMRFGLMRALGPFPHPILGGTLLASLLPLAWYLPKRPRNRIVALGIAASSIFTVSSTAVLTFLVSAALVAATILQRVTRWPIIAMTTVTAVFGAVAISVLSEGGLISFIVRRLTFNAVSGNYRRLVWDIAGREAQNNPWFGIGTRSWERPAWMVSESIDAHWLLLAVRYGYPQAIVTFLLFTGAAIFLAVRYRHQPLRHRYAALALCYSLLALVFAGFSVALWEAVYMWAIMLCGIAVSMAGNVRSAKPWQQEHLPIHTNPYTDDFDGPVVTAIASDKKR